MKPAFRCFWPVDRKISLHARVGLVLTSLAAVLLLLLAGLWLQGTRNSVHEEVEAATRVSRQWLETVIGELRGLPAAERGERLLAVAQRIGRVRANVLTIERITDGTALHVSPPSAYKAGRNAPDWFADLLTPTLVPVVIDVDQLRLRLQPDPSRAILDAWDALVAMAGWAILLLVGLFAGVSSALRHALRPLEQIMTALDRTGQGRFDTRLPAFAGDELSRLSRAFNGMADRLKSAVDDNVRLETEREVAERMQARLEAERRDIARELHDELAQGITAVRALAGAIVQRTPDSPNLHGPAQSIVAVTGAMQEGVRHILHRLRPEAAGGLAERLAVCLEHWRSRHEIDLDAAIQLGPEPLPEALAQTTLRFVQEGLTNVVRHAQASRVVLSIQCRDHRLHLSLADNGRGCDGQRSTQAGCGLGLAGMRERIALLGGQLEIYPAALGGFALQAWLPLIQENVS